MDLKKPIISVIMPLYNKGDYVNRAIESVFLQTVNNLELIVVNDGSTDTGPEAVRSIHDPRVRIVDQKNAGVSAARNRGIGEASSDLIAFLDADDEWRADFLETIVRLRNNFPSCDVFATAYQYSTPDGLKRPIFFRGMPKHPSEGVVDFSFSFDFDPPFNLSSLAVTKRAITSVGKFPVGITIGEDLLTRVRLRLNYDIAYSTHSCSTYWAPESGRPGRLPQYPDLVGDELDKLLKKSNPAMAGELRELAVSWHRRRGIMHVSLGEKKKASEEIRKAMDKAGFSWDLCVLATIARMPGRFSEISLDILKRIKGVKRRLVAMAS